MEDKYSKAYKEVVEILNFVPKESVDKIPQDLINTFREKMDNNYNFSIDLDKSFEEQVLLDETKAIFANIFRDYWATNEQKEKIRAKEKSDRQKIEEEKSTKYNINNLFNNKTEKRDNEEISIKTTNESLYKKLIKYIKKWLKIA